jgi:hypothetical protein
MGTDSKIRWRGGKLRLKLGANAVSLLADADAETITRGALWQRRTYPIADVTVGVRKPELQVGRGAFGSARARVSRPMLVVDLPDRGTVYTVIPKRRLADAYRFAVLYGEQRAASRATRG